MTVRKGDSSSRPQEIRDLVVASEEQVGVLRVERLEAAERRLVLSQERDGRRFAVGEGRDQLPQARRIVDPGAQVDMLPQLQETRELLRVGPPSENRDDAEARLPRAPHQREADLLIHPELHPHAAHQHERSRRPSR